MKEKIIRFFRAIRRFWRGSGIRMRVAILFLAVTVAAGSVYLIVDATVPPKNNDEYTAVDTLFGTIKRASIQSILLHPAEGEEYEIALHDESYEVGGQKYEHSVFRLKMKGVVYEWLSLNEEALSTLVVYAGTNYVSEPIISAPAESDPDYEIKMTAYRRKLAEYRLDPATSPYYELTDKAGNTYRVYYGIATPDGKGYYVIQEGKDAIYASVEQNIGLALADGPEQFIDGHLFFESSTQYAYAYPAEFTVINGTRVTLSGHPVKDGDLVAVLNKTAEGKEEMLYIRLGNESLPAVFHETLRGSVIGPVDKQFVCHYPDDYDDETVRGKSVAYHFTEIVYVEQTETEYTLAFVNPDDRKPYRPFCMYEFLAPERLRGFLPNTDTYLTILEKLLTLTGTPVHIGLNDDTVTKYGLYRHTISLSYPGNMVMDENDNIIPYDETTGKGTVYLPALLFISDVTENGTRYVGTNAYGIVVEVEADALSFLDSSFISKIESQIFTMHDTESERLHFYWNYGNAFKNAELFLELSKVTEENPNPQIESILADVDGGGALAIHPDNYAEFYLQLTYLKYMEEADLSDEEIADLIANPDSDILELNMILRNGTVQIYRFIPVSDGRILVVTRPEQGMSQAGAFLIHASDFDALARNYLRLVEGKTVNHQNRYE